MYLSKKATNRLKLIATPVIILVLLLAFSQMLIAEQMAQGGEDSLGVNAGNNPSTGATNSQTATPGDTSGQTITPNNPNPIAIQQSVTTDEDTSVGITLEGGDSGNDALTYSVVTGTGPDHGTLTGTSPNLTYNPDSNFVGSDSFEFQVNDGDGGTDTGTVNITVNPVNDNPNAVDDTVTTDEDTPINIHVLSNDSDPDAGDMLSVSDLDTADTMGEVTINPIDTVEYNPNGQFEYLSADETAEDTFTYTASDGNGSCGISTTPILSDTATVTVTIQGLNDPPIANDDQAITNEDTPVEIDVLANDKDPDQSDTLSVVSTSQPTNGQLTVNNDNTITYSPNENFNGTDSFTYTVSDGNSAKEKSAKKTLDTATVTVTINPVNDPPIANDDSTSTEEGIPVTIDLTVNDTDVDGTIDKSTVTVTGGPVNGTVVTNNDGTVTYTPDTDYTGSDSFEYTVNDNGGAISNQARVTIEVGAVNDPPSVTDDLLTVDEGATATTLSTPSGANSLLQNDTDPEGDTLKASLVKDVNYGSLTLNDDGTFTYTHDGSENFTDSFTYQATDGTDTSNVATVTITVNPVNDPPRALNDKALTEEDKSIAVDVLANDSDPDGTLLPSTITVIKTADHGSTEVNSDNGKITYTPDTDYNGQDTFTYRISDDDNATDTAVVTITITPVSDNTPPVVENRFFTTCSDTPITMTLKARDLELEKDNPEEHQLTFSIWNDPMHGTLSGNLEDIEYEKDHEGTIELTYTPQPGFSGDDSFTYQVEDPTGAFDQAEVRITVEICEEIPSEDQEDQQQAGRGAEVKKIGEVAINELAWSGTNTNPEHEWIELINNTDKKVDLTGWSLRWRKNKKQEYKSVELTGFIPAHGFYLLERISDDTVSNMTADLIYDKEKPYHLPLSDTGEKMELLDKKGNLIDTANSQNTKEGWPAGSINPLSSMERVDPKEEDIMKNWSTNKGKFIRGLDAKGLNLTATPNTVNESYLIGRNPGTKPRKLHPGQVFSFLIRKPREKVDNFDALLVKPSSLTAGGAGAISKRPSLIKGEKPGLGKYHVVFNSSQANPGKYRIFFMVNNETYFHECVEVVE